MLREISKLLILGLPVLKLRILVT
uniref:Serine/threonine-protein kinase HT1-like n=1 Tax=Rhizophora mucronata TaxID=61149 RepID=A0A2P2KMH6_RHIMU